MMKREEPSFIAVWLPLLATPLLYLVWVIPVLTLPDRTTLVCA